MARHLPAARILWLLTATLMVALAVAAVPDYLREAGAVASASQRSFSQLTPAELEILQQWGLSAQAYAVYVLAWSMAPIVAYIVVASLIFQRSPEPGAAFWISLMLVVIGGATPFLGGITEFSSPVSSLGHLVRAAGTVLLLCLFFVFPDGRFVPRRSAWLMLAWVGWMASWIVIPAAPWGLMDATGAVTPFGLLAILVGFGAGIAAQLYRYRRVSTPLQRQQSKVLALGFAAMVLVYLVAVGPFFLAPGVRAAGWPYLLYGLIWVPLLTRAALSLLPLLIGFAVLRYHLWDIDVIIRRTLIYGGLTGALALVYAATVIVLSPLFTTLTGRPQSELATVASTLATAALFGPLRGAVQHAIDRRFYRHKYDAGQALAAFSSRVSEEVDVERLTDHLMDAVGETLQPAHVSLWLRKK